MAFEVNFDGLVGPTHNYSGLSFGNIASVSHRAQVSNPREAALQGLRKMKELFSRGLRQGVIPPQERPDIATLRKLGFGGSDAEVLERAAKTAPAILSACSSASSMWTANAATVAPSSDTADGKTHFTPANLSNKFHRSIEPATTSRILKAIFSDPSRFSHHAPLPAGGYFSDEGAANHTRLAPSHGEPGVQFFVYGRTAFQPGPSEPVKFPARQTLEASEAIARLHRLDPARTVFARQNPAAIDAGVFHNDVAAVGNEDVLFHHELAFADSARVIAELRSKLELRVIEVPHSEVCLEDAVRSYLFNSQLVTLPRGGLALIAPVECSETPSVKAWIDRNFANGQGPVTEVEYLDLRQSMNNGGGPACLRLRVVLTREEIDAVTARVFIDDSLHDELATWVKKHYRDRLAFDDLRDPKLLVESRAALDELTRILGLGSIYPFQLATAPEET